MDIGRQQRVIVVEPLTAPGIPVRTVDAGTAVEMEREQSAPVPDRRTDMREEG